MDMRVESKADDKGITVKIYGARTSYAFLDAPDKVGVYRSQFILPKDCKGISELRQQVIELGNKAFGKGGWKSAAIKDGDLLISEKVNAGLEADDFAIYKNSYVLSGNAGKDHAPDVRSIPGTGIYSGCYVAAILRIVPYDNTKDGMRSTGVKAYLNAVVFMGEGEKLGSSERMTADDLGIAMPDILPKVKSSDDFNDTPF